jgi:uncharacterized protein (TIGR02466 family)
MIETQVHGIFPTPVYSSSINRKLSKEENNFINDKKIQLHKNTGNFASNNNYILENKIFKKLKKEIILKIEDYFKKIICTKNNVTPYITQSWLNYTKENEYHHTHEHPNSMLSGVFYINADKNNDKINFYDRTYRQIFLEVEKYNQFNSSNWWFAVESGQIILFPSSLTHMVETKKGNNTRISLAFNVFVKGTLGKNSILTELILK